MIAKLVGIEEKSIKKGALRYIGKPYCFLLYGWKLDKASYVHRCVNSYARQS